MDDSYSSDIFPENEELSRSGYIDMDIMSYKKLLSNMKSTLAADIRIETKKPSFSAHFTSILGDCNTCISQSLDLVIGLVMDPDLQINKLCEYMEDAVCILQMLSNFIKNVVESVSMECCNMKTFPTTVGQIIMSVFLHCKDSETLYGSYLGHVQTQLKDLFRTCHELQLTYLMILEKHFIFDLTEKEEQDIFVDALNINLKIGEIVQTLDVKTMAEQWKAFTMMCEKYSSCLINKNKFDECTKILCTMIENNIKIALQPNQEDKLIMRSLKVANFTIKILLKTCDTLKHAVDKDYTHIVELLLYIYLNNSAYQELTQFQPPQFRNLIDVNVSNPADSLVGELLMDTRFFKAVSKYGLNEIRQEDRMLGYIILIISIMKSVQKNENQTLKISKKDFIKCVMNLIPYCKVWFSLGLKFRDSNLQQSFGLYEHLLMNTIGFISTLSSEEMTTLEQFLYENLMSTECVCALFSSNLWILIARISSRQFTLDQLLALCRIYQKLENQKLFLKSPQQMHISYTISRLFEILPNEDKMKVYKLFSLQDDKNVTLWCALKIKNLPENIQGNVKAELSERLKMKLHRLCTSSIRNTDEVYGLIRTLKLAATGVLTDTAMQEYISKAWTVACPKKNKFVTKETHAGILWYLEYIEALTALSLSVNLCENNPCLIKICHVISNIIEISNTELTLLILELLCKITDSTIMDETKHHIDDLTTELFRKLFNETNKMVKHIFLNILQRYSGSNNIEYTITKALIGNVFLQEEWHNYRNRNVDYINWKRDLLSTMYFKYSHKCTEFRFVKDYSESKSISNSGNFDFADIDEFFDVDNSSEPACKKPKLGSDTDEIISRLENDAELLCKVKENVFTDEYRNRIKNVCDKLRNIIY